MPPKPRPHGKRKPRVATVPKASSTTGGRDNNKLIAMLALGGVALLAVIGLGAALAFGGGNDGTDARTALEAAGCTLSTAPALVGAHSVPTPEGTSKDWNTTPPTSGPHYQSPAVWGAYDDPVNQAQVVHNLEHGGVAIQYGSEVPAETVESLKGFVQANDRGTILAPSSALGDRIAIGAWVTENASEPEKGMGYLAKCPDFDETAFTAFFDSYQFRGPERLPADALLPGRT